MLTDTWAFIINKVMCGTWQENKSAGGWLLEHDYFAHTVWWKNTYLMTLEGGCSDDCCVGWMSKMYCSLIILDCPESVMLRPQRNKRRSILCSGISCFLQLSHLFISELFQCSFLPVEKFRVQGRTGAPLKQSTINKQLQLPGVGGSPCCLGEDSTAL